MSKRKEFNISSSLTEALEETAQAADNYSGQLRIEILPLKKIEVDPNNPREMAINFIDILNNFSKNDPLYDRKKKELESLQPMAESIKREGIINPIVVYKQNDKYCLVAGERRTLASMVAGKEYIQAKILEKKPSELKLRSLQWIENVERENLTLWERLRNLEKIIDANKEDENNIKEITPTKLSQFIGCALSHAMNYCYVLNSDKTIKKAIEENKIRSLEKAALVAQINSPDLRASVMSTCIEGATLKQLKKMVLENKNEKKRRVIILNKPKRGRQATQVDLGATKKIAAVKFLINLILQNDKYRFLEATITSLNLDDFSDISKAFKKILQALEEKE